MPSVQTISVRNLDGYRMTLSPLEITLDLFPESIIVVDSRGKVTFCSSSLAKLWGFAVNDITGTSLDAVREIISKQFDSPDLFVQKVKELDENPEAEWTSEFTLLNGQTCRINTKILREGDKSVGRLFCFYGGLDSGICGKDTGAEHMKFEELFNSAPFGVVQYGLDGKLCHANQTLAQLFGYESQSELVKIVNGTSVRHLIFEDWRYGLELEKRSLDSKGHWLLDEARFRRKDGSIFDGEIYMRANEYSKIVFQGFLRDISSRKKADYELQENQKRLLSSFQFIKDLIDSHSESFDTTTLVESPQTLPDAARLLEMSYIENALRKTNGKVQPAARILGISRYALMRQIAKMGIDPKKFK